MSQKSWIVAGLGSLPVLAACFSDRVSSVDDVPEYVSCESGAPAPPANVRVVRIRNFAFEPAQLSVTSGTTVYWINCEVDNPVNSHTTTSDTGIWDSPLLAPAGRGVFDFQFNNSGTFPYHCTPHPQMEGTITVG
jgi:plastocyanin